MIIEKTLLKYDWSLAINFAIDQCHSTPGTVIVILLSPVDVSTHR